MFYLNFNNLNLCNVSVYNFMIGIYMYMCSLKELQSVLE